MQYDANTHEYIYKRVNGSTYRAKDLFPNIVQSFWNNDVTEWDPEKKITWDEIAPSLQELIIRLFYVDDIVGLRDELNGLDTKITNVNNRVTKEINDRTNQDELLQEQIDDLKRRMTLAENRITVLEARMDETERQIYLIWIEIRKLWQEIFDIWGSDGKIAPDHDITHIWAKLRELEQAINNLVEDVKNILINMEGKFESIAQSIRDLYDVLSEVDWGGGASPPYVPPGGGGSGTGQYYITVFDMGPQYGYIEFSNGFKMCWLPIHLDSNSLIITNRGTANEERIPGTICDLKLPSGRTVSFTGDNTYVSFMTTDEHGAMGVRDTIETMYVRPYSKTQVLAATLILADLSDVAQKLANTAINTQTLITIDSSTEASTDSDLNNQISSLQWHPYYYENDQVIFCVGY